MQQSDTQSLFSKREPIQAYTIYLWLVSVTGIVLIAYSLLQVTQFTPLFNFLLLAVLMVAAQFTTETLPYSGKSGVTYSISSALTLAAIPLFGVAGAILIDAIGAFVVWIVKPQDDAVWKKKLSQLAFNTGVIVSASFLAGIFYTAFDASRWYTEIPVWVITAFLYDQVNLWGVLIILRLQHGSQFSLLKTWKDNRWATSISILNSALGGGFLLFAARSFGWLGILVFFLPIILSAYAFFVYTSQTKAQMANMENIIAERTQELTQLNTEKDAFLALLSHDMKSPLTSIGMYAEMMRRKPDVILQKPHTIDNILRAHATLSDLVNNIVDLEKLQSGGELALERSLFDVTDLTEYVVDLLQPQAEHKQILLTNQVTRRSIHLHADRLQIERVLTNLISNAIKYTKENGQVHVRVWLTPHDVCIAVKDTGYGIPEEELPFIFDRYRRVDKHRNKAVGTGLGLAIAKAIAESHGGSLVAESAEHVGSTFTLTLPLTS